MLSKAFVLSFLLGLNQVAAWTQMPRGVPRLLGRRGFVAVEDLPDLKVKRRELATLEGLSVKQKRAVSPDGTCGPANSGFTCPETGDEICCSQFGFCGNTDGHCGDGCQAAYGKCGAGNVVGGCGVEFGNKVCPSGQCCSQGSCGTTVDFCEAPLCEQGFGVCQSDATPGGTNTSSIARPANGAISYGTDIFDCADTPGTIALTYDDGPDIYTNDLLDIIANYSGAKVTFFITGINNNKGEIDITPAWTSVIQKAHAAGHQIASHTWSHQNLSSLTEAGRRTEMIKNEMALRNILGFFPAYMRPPYSECNNACRATMKALGYHIIYFDVDTDDYDNDSPDLIQNSKNNFNDAIGPSNPKTDNFLVIEHDIHQQTVYNLTAYMLDTLLAKGYTPVTVGECLGDSSANWYRTAGGAPTTTATTSTKSSSSTSSTTTTSASKTSTSATPTSTACAVTLDGWCAPPLATYAVTSDCWDTVATCYAQGDDCYNTVTADDQTYCDAYDADVCDAQENNCQACADAHGDSLGPCAFLTPVYPATPNARIRT